MAIFVLLQPCILKFICLHIIIIDKNKVNIQKKENYPKEEVSNAAKTNKIKDLQCNTACRKI